MNKFLGGILTGVIICAIILGGGFYLLSRGLSPLRQNKTPQQDQSAQKHIPDFAAKIAQADSPQNALLRADMLASGGNYRQALDLYNSLIANGQDGAEIYFKRAAVKFLTGDALGASQDLTQAITKNPAMAEAYFNRGAAKINLYDINAALQDFATAQKLFAQRGEQQNAQRAQSVLTLAKDFQAKYTQTETSGKNPSPQSKTRPSQPAAQGANNSSEETNKILTENLKKEINSAASKEILEKFQASLNKGGGQGMGEFGDYVRQAAQTLKEYQKNAPENVLDYRSRAAKHMAGGNYKEAVSALNSALEKSPQDYDLYIQRARALAEQKDRAGAIKDLDKAIELNPQSSSAHLERGRLQALNGNTSAALKDFNTAKEQAQQQGNQPLADEAQRQADITSGKRISVRTKDSEAEALFTKAANAFADQDFAAASKMFGELLKQYPNEVGLNYNKGIADLQSGDYKTAEKTLEQALKLDNNLPDAWLALSSAQSLQNKADKAFESVNKAIELNPKTPAVYLQRAKLYAQQNNIDKTYEDAYFAYTIAKTDEDRAQAKQILDIIKNYKEQQNNAGNK